MADTLDDMAYGGGAPPAAPMNISPAAQNAQDPQAGAGWKQTLNGVAGAIGNAAGNFQINNGQVGQKGASGPAAPGAPRAPTSPINDPNGMRARANQLLAQGVISPEQHQQLMLSLQGGQSQLGQGGQPQSAAWGQ